MCCALLLLSVCAKKGLFIITYSALPRFISYVERERDMIREREGVRERGRGGGVFGEAEGHSDKSHSRPVR